MPENLLAAGAQRLIQPHLLHGHAAADADGIGLRDGFQQIMLRLLCVFKGMYIIAVFFQFFDKSIQLFHERSLP